MALLSRFEQDGIHRCKRLVSALVPVLPGCLNLGPVAVDPAFEHSQRFGERVGECRQLIQRGGFDAAGVEVTNDEAVSFGSSERLRKHLMGDAVKSLVEVLIAASTASEFSEHESPTSTEELDKSVGSPPLRRIRTHRTGPSRSFESPSMNLGI